MIHLVKFMLDIDPMEYMQIAHKVGLLCLHCGFPNNERLNCEVKLHHKNNQTRVGLSS